MRDRKQIEKEIDQLLLHADKDKPGPHLFAVFTLRWALDLEKEPPSKVLSKDEALAEEENRIIRI